MGTRKIPTGLDNHNAASSAAATTSSEDLKGEKE